MALANSLASQSVQGHVIKKANIISSHKIMNVIYAIIFFEKFKCKRAVLYAAQLVLTIFIFPIITIVPYELVQPAPTA